MHTYRYKISAIFSQRDQAEAAYSTLLQQGIAPAQLSLHNTGSTACNTISGNHTNNDVLSVVLINGTIGAVIGTLTGLAIEVALVIAKVNLFVASPLIAPLVLIGWGASFGAVIGAVIGVVKKNNPLALRAREPGVGEQIELVVETHNHQQTSAVKKTIDAMVGSYNNIRISQR